MSKFFRISGKGHNIWNPKIWNRNSGNRITGNLSKLPDVSIIRRWIRKRIKAYQEDLEVMHREAPSRRPSGEGQAGICGRMH